MFISAYILLDDNSDKTSSCRSALLSCLGTEQQEQDQDDTTSACNCWTLQARTGSLNGGVDCGSIGTAASGHVSTDRNK